jgi:hypothetical protein
MEMLSFRSGGTFGGDIEREENDIVGHMPIAH